MKAKRSQAAICVARKIRNAGNVYSLSNQLNCAQLYAVQMEWSNLHVAIAGVSC